MATATARRSAAPAANAVIPASMTHEDLMALLGQAGAVAQGGEYHRMKLNSGVLETDDGGMFPAKMDRAGNPEPSLSLRIVRPPVYYSAIFLSDKGSDGGAVDASVIGRQDLNGRFTRRYDDPAAQAADNNPANEVYDDIVRVTGKKGSFKGDLEVQIVPESGQMIGDETIYTLSLSTTSVFEWRGSSKDPEAGSATDRNFMVRLAQFAINKAIEAGGDEAAQRTAVLNALTSLRMGGVVADAYLIRMQNEDKTNSWWVISFDPTHIEPVEGDTPTLEASTTDAPSDEIPF